MNIPHNDLVLIEPHVAYASAFRDLVRDYSDQSEDVPHTEYLEALADFGIYCSRLHLHEEGLDLPRGWVPSSTRWLVRRHGEKCILGVVRIRHRLTRQLLKSGGHIGYDVPPAHRRRRYATTMLALAVREAERLGLRKVLLVCDRTNIPSRRVIEANGGLLARGHGRSENELRYWIHTAAP